MRRCSNSSWPLCRVFIVMAGLGPAIHVFLVRLRQRRGWPDQPGHDGGAEAGA